MPHPADPLAAEDIEVRRLWTSCLTLATLRASYAWPRYDPRWFRCHESTLSRWLILNGASQRRLSRFMRGSTTRLAMETLNHATALAVWPALRAWSAPLHLPGAVFCDAGRHGPRRFLPVPGLKARCALRVFHPAKLLLRRRSKWRVSHVRLFEFDVQAEIVGGEDYGRSSTSPVFPSVGRTDGLHCHRERLRDDGVAFECHWDRRCIRTKTLRVADHSTSLCSGSFAVPSHSCREIVARDPLASDALQVKRSRRSVPSGVAYMRECCPPPPSLSGFVELSTPGPTDPSPFTGMLAPPPRALSYFATSSPTPNDRRIYPCAVSRPRARRYAATLCDSRQDVASMALSSPAPCEFRWELRVNPDEPTRWRYHGRGAIFIAFLDGN